MGQIGEVCIQGPNVTKGYLNNPKANAEAYAGGACPVRLPKAWTAVWVILTKPGLLCGLSLVCLNGILGPQ